MTNRTIEEGYRDYFAGYSDRENPYHHDDRRYAEWMRGWYRAQNDEHISANQQESA